MKMKWRRLYPESKSTIFFDLDEHGNPTIPTSDDVGELDEIEYSSEVVDRIWELVK